MLSVVIGLIFWLCWLYVMQLVLGAVHTCLHTPSCPCVHFLSRILHHFNCQYRMIRSSFAFTLHLHLTLNLMMALKQSCLWNQNRDAAAESVTENFICNIPLTISDIFSCPVTWNLRSKLLTNVNWFVWYHSIEFIQVKTGRWEVKLRWRP